MLAIPTGNAPETDMDAKVSIGSTRTVTPFWQCFAALHAAGERSSLSAIACGRMRREIESDACGLLASRNK